jgi:hypothetical protein
MILLDSNLFVIDRFFPRDTHYPANHAFLQALSTLEASLSVFTLVELCGIASFNLTTKELRTWLFDFPQIYSVRILDPWGIGIEPSQVWCGRFVIELMGNIERKMTFGDAVLLHEAEQYAVEALITWNTKDFVRRTTIPVLTPTAYLQQHLSI